MELNQKSQFSEWLVCLILVYIGNTVVITDCTKYLEGIKSGLLDGSKFMQLPIDEGNRISYIINLKSKLKDHFKILKNEEKIYEKKNW